MTKPSRKIYQIRVTLIGAQPPIWRRLLIRSDATFQDLHRIIQTAMGWQGYHLHIFQAADGTLVSDPAEDFDGALDYLDETVVPVSDVLNKESQQLKYEYDFGDSWEHEVTLEKILPDNHTKQLPKCVKAVCQCPPEDVGGLPGFYEFLEAMENPAHPDHIEMLEWRGGEWFDPEFVDLDRINDDIARRDALFDESANIAPPSAGDFFGLSPFQMHELLQNPLNCPSVFKPLFDAEAVNQVLDTAPVIRMAKTLIEAMGEKGIKMTSKGNLPLRQVNAMIEAGGEGVVFPMASFGRARSEEAVLAVHLTRVLLELAGYTKRLKGSLLLKKSALSRLEQKGWLTLYRDILAAALSKLNWAWIYNGESLEDVQTIGPFCFWLLSEKSGQWQPVPDYLNNILSAFPQLPLTADPLPYSTQEEQTLSALRYRMIALYRILGLIELNPEHTLFTEKSQQMMRRTALFEGMFVRT